MFELKGKYGVAAVYADVVDQECISQVVSFLNQDFTAGARIAIMPDAHAGVGCVIGTTMKIKDKICPNLVGVDIGCGMETVYLEDKSIDFEALDAFIREKIPTGAERREKTHDYLDKTRLDDLAYKDLPTAAVAACMGTLGGGNHFIEVERDSGGRLALVIHTGSRIAGKRTAEHYQRLAYAQMRGTDRPGIKAYTAELKAEGHTRDIPVLVNAYKNRPTPGIDPELAYLTGYALDEYLNDMKILQEYADLNRRAIAHDIVSGLGLTVETRFSTIHNYVDLDAKILRKGAVGARDGELILIPVNMRDGSLVCRGKGNPDWNFSAPHGAGRLLSRSGARASIGLDEYRQSMAGIYTTSVSEDTIDESPMAYKDPAGIMAAIEDTAEIMDVMKPLYNFKAGKIQFE